MTERYIVAVEDGDVKGTVRHSGAFLKTDLHEFGKRSAGYVHHQLLENNVATTRIADISFPVLDINTDRR